MTSAGSRSTPPAANPRASARPLIVSDMVRFRIRTNWTNSVSRTHEFELEDLADASTRDRCGQNRPDDRLRVRCHCLPAQAPHRSIPARGGEPSGARHFFRTSAGGRRLPERAAGGGVRHGGADSPGCSCQRRPTRCRSTPPVGRAGRRASAERARLQGTRPVAGWRATTPKPSDGTDAPQNRENASGQYNLGVMYADGRGVARDDAEAVRWYRRAAEQGNASGQYNLGGMYSTGRGVARDDAEAVRWYRRAAEQGNASGQYNLGLGEQWNRKYGRRLDLGPPE